MQLCLLGSLAQSVEQQAFNLLVLRSNRRRPNKINRFDNSNSDVLIDYLRGITQAEHFPMLKNITIPYAKTTT